jgi:glycosyltransferase involved in cell wall biosynthesis
MKVTIGIPTFNREMWIANAIESALEQTWPNKEVIVVDDGSTDRTAEICALYEDRITYVHQDHSGAISTVRNHILRLATGDWIQYLDDDDYLLPNKLEVQLTSIAHENTPPEAIFSPLLGEEWKDGVAVRRWLYPLSDPNEPKKVWLRAQFPQIGPFLIQREPLKAIGAWNDSVPFGEDNELYMRMLLNGWRFHFVEPALSVWRYWSAGGLGVSNAKGCFLRYLALIDRYQKELVSRGEWNDSLQVVADEGRFNLARGIADTDLPRALAYYSQATDENLMCHRYATSSWKVTAVYRLLGFKRAFQLAQLMRKIKPPTLPRRAPG